MKRCPCLLLLLAVLLMLLEPLFRGAVWAEEQEDRIRAFLERQPGVLATYYDGVYPAWYSVAGYARYYDVDPYLLLALMETVTGVVTNPAPPDAILQQPFGPTGPQGFTAQVGWAAQELMRARELSQSPPTLQFADGQQMTLNLSPGHVWFAIWRFLAIGRTYAELYALDARIRIIYPAYAREHQVQYATSDTAGYTGTFAFFQPPTISEGLYVAILEEARSPAAREGRAMYQALVAAGIDPVVELAFARKETSFGRTGPGRNYNLYGITCNRWDAAYGGACAGRFSRYPSYTASTQAWAALIWRYSAGGMTTPRLALPMYAPPFENDTDLYIEQVEQWVTAWRAREVQQSW